MASQSILHLVILSGGFPSLGSFPAAVGLFRSRLTSIPHYAEIRNNRQRAFSDAKCSNQLAGLSHIIQNNPGGVFGDEVGVAILNGWNYRPRPTVQSFAAYTAYLETLNRD